MRGQYVGDAKQIQAARAADASTADRVAALERYAAEVREADTAYRDWRQAAKLADLSDQHLEMLARTAADEHGIAEIEAMSQQARAVRHALRERPG